MTQSPVVKAIMMDDVEEGKESTSPGQFQDGSLDSLCSQSSIPFSLGMRSPGKVSPLRGRTMKEYEEQLGNLKKENFSLKLRIYFLEERMGQKYDKDDKEDLYKTNIELKVEAEGLKRELFDKQELLRQASTALSGLEQQFQDQLTQIKDDKDQEKGALEEKVQQMQKELEEYADRCRADQSSRLGELTQLCGLAFSTADEDSQASVPNDLSQCSARPNTSNLSLPLTVNTPDFSAPQLHQGLDSMTGSKGTHPSSMNQTLNPSGQTYSDSQDAAGLAKIAELEALVVQLESKVHELEGELAAKEETNNILQGDLCNLNKELKDNIEKIADLEEEVTEKDVKLDNCMQELETRHVEIKAKEGQIQVLSDDLNKVEPEMEIKVQEIVERDRIIESKIEQIEQQQKILVEIQITLDEKQKQIAELEASLREATDKAGKLTQELDNSCKVVQSLAEEVGSRDKDIVNLKKELKRRDKKIKDLVNELKEAMDMLRKAKWEAETSGGEDGVKEMAEEENEVNNNNGQENNTWSPQVLTQTRTGKSYVASGPTSATYIASDTHNFDPNMHEIKFQQASGSLFQQTYSDSTLMTSANQYNETCDLSAVRDPSFSETHLGDPRIPAFGVTRTILGVTQNSDASCLLPNSPRNDNRSMKHWEALRSRVLKQNLLHASYVPE